MTDLKGIMNSIVNSIQDKEILKQIKLVDILKCESMEQVLEIVNTLNIR